MPFVPPEYPKCVNCIKSVYPNEQLDICNKTFHKGCFRCSQCNCTLNLKSFCHLHDKLYCKPHFTALVREQGYINQKKPSTNTNLVINSTADRGDSQHDVAVVDNVENSSSQPASFSTTSGLKRDRKTDGSSSSSSSPSPETRGRKVLCSVEQNGGQTTAASSTSTLSAPSSDSTAEPTSTVSVASTRSLFERLDEPVHQAQPIRSRKPNLPKKPARSGPINPDGGRIVASERLSPPVELSVEQNTVAATVQQLSESPPRVVHKDKEPATTGADGNEEEEEQDSRPKAGHLKRMLAMFQKVANEDSSTPIKGPSHQKSVRRPVQRTRSPSPIVDEVPKQVNETGAAESFKEKMVGVSSSHRTENARPIGYERTLVSTRESYEKPTVWENRHTADNVVGHQKASTNAAADTSKDDNNEDDDDFSALGTITVPQLRRLKLNQPAPPKRTSKPKHFSVGNSELDESDAESSEAAFRDLDEIVSPTGRDNETEPLAENVEVDIQIDLDPQHMVPPLAEDETDEFDDDFLIVPRVSSSPGAPAAAGNSGNSSNVQSPADYFNRNTSFDKIFTTYVDDERNSMTRDGDVSVSSMLNMYD